MTATKATTETPQARRDLRAPIDGVPFPRHHPAWCDEQMHIREWESVHHEGYSDASAPPCHRYVAAGWLPTIHRCKDLPATREGQASWDVTVEQAQLAVVADGAYARRSYLRAGDVVSFVGDSVIVLTMDNLPAMRLLPGEARELAAALIRGADVEQFSRLGTP